MLLAAAALSLIPLWLAPVEASGPGDQQRAPVAVADLEIAGEPGVSTSADPPVGVAFAAAGPVRAGAIAAPLPETGPNAARPLAVLAVAPKTSPPRDA